VTVINGNSSSQPKMIWIGNEKTMNPGNLLIRTNSVGIRAYMLDMGIW